jgi:hypothetical protein
VSFFPFVKAILRIPHPSHWCRNPFDEQFRDYVRQQTKITVISDELLVPFHTR